MTINRKLMAAFGAAVLGLVVSSAKASLVTVGDPFTTNSWAQGFQEAGVTFDFMAVVDVSGATFESPIFRNFSSGYSSTAGSDDNGTAAWVGTTSPINWVQFDLEFNDPQGSATFDFYAFYQGSCVDSAVATTNDGRNWTFSAVAPSDIPSEAELKVIADVPAVPLPASAGVGFGMLGGFGALFGMRKRLSRRPRIA